MKRLFLATALIGFVAPTSANATDGYLAHGYGIKSSGAGGVGIALPQDTFVVASNPAGIAWLNDRFDFGITYFRPDRQAEIEGSPLPINGKVDGNDTQHFYLPEFGLKKQITPDISFGIATYTNGGLVQDYKPGFPLFVGPNGPKTGIELLQLFVTPTIAWKINPGHSVGVTLNVAYQTFEAKGLDVFKAVSQSPGHVTDNGKDRSLGFGLRIGWLGQISDRVTLGASYQTRTHAQRFNRYKGLFPEEGDFDIPSIFGLGIAFKATPDLIFAADYQRINYSDTSVSGNSLTLADPFGSTSGTGFGWRDMNVYKIGVIYNYSERLTLRTGFNHGKQPVPRDQTLFSVLAPGIAEDHLTFGGTWRLESNDEISFSYMHAFEQEVKGNNSIPAAFGGGDINFRMKQDAIGIAYSWAL